MALMNEMTITKPTAVYQPSCGRFYCVRTAIAGGEWNEMPCAEHSHVATILADMVVLSFMLHSYLRDAFAYRICAAHSRLNARSHIS
jgi:hypothetical protein